MTDKAGLPPLALLSGGLATRLWPLTEKIPKAMIGVAGEPFVAHQLRHAAREGIDRIVLCVGHLADRVEAFVGDGKAFGVRVIYSYEPRQLLGTGGALLNALPLLGDEFLVQYGDSYLEVSYASVVRALRQSGRQALMTVFRNDSRWDVSNVEFVDGTIRNYDKINRTPNMAFIDYGLGAFKAAALRQWPAGERIDLSKIYARLLAEGQLAGYEVHQRFYEIGSVEGLSETDRYLLSRSERQD
jgi:NDP-sugar pyrophosphorylase family protein